VAEEIIFGEVSTGAHDDLSKATDIAKSMVKEFGMSEKIGHITYEKERKSMFLDISPDFSSKDYSEETSREIDSEIRSIIEGAYKMVKSTLSEKKDLLEKVARILLEKEVIEGEELRRLIREYTEQNDDIEYRKEADRSH
jgi:cell division protease FtsH